MRSAFIYGFLDELEKLGVYKTPEVPSLGRVLPGKIKKWNPFAGRQRRKAVKELRRLRSPGTPGAQRAARKELAWKRGVATGTMKAGPRADPLEKAESEVIEAHKAKRGQQGIERGKPSHRRELLRGALKGHAQRMSEFMTRKFLK
jgi:hypothetical protein